MNKAVSSNMILTIGILLAVGLALFQLRSLFVGQTKTAQENIIYTFGRDIQRIVEKSKSIAGNTTFVYEPMIKDYTFRIDGDKIEIGDKITGKNISFFEMQLKMGDEFFEDKPKIYIRKIADYGTIYFKECKERTENCEYSYQCCVPFCWGSGSDKTCQSNCAPNGNFASDEIACCSNYLDEYTGKCKDGPSDSSPTTTLRPGPDPTIKPPDPSPGDDLVSCPGTANNYVDDFNANKDLIYSAIDEHGLEDFFDDKREAAMLIAAMITRESNWRNNAIRCEDSYECPPGYTGTCYGPWDRYVEQLGCESYGCDELIDSPQGTYHKVSCSYGLMQFMFPTAWGNGYRGEPEGLYESENIIPLGVKYIKGKINQCKSEPQCYGREIECGLSAYNTGSRCDPDYSYANKVMESYLEWLDCDSGGSQPEPEFSIVWPTVGGSITSCFWESRPAPTVNHKGIDIAVPTGTDILAPADGEVVAIGSTTRGGKYIKMKFDDENIWLVYYHLDSFSSNIGDKFSKGELVAKSGNTGTSTTGPHLHFQMQSGLYESGSDFYDPCEHFSDTKGKTECNRVCGTPMT